MYEDDAGAHLAVIELLRHYVGEHNLTIHTKQLL
jgi:hypothetical protein